MTEQHMTEHNLKQHIEDGPHASANEVHTLQSETQTDRKNLSDETFVSPLESEDLGADFNDIYPSMCPIVRDLDMRLLEYTLHYKGLLWSKEQEIKELKKSLEKKDKEIEELKKAHSQELSKNDDEIKQLKKTLETKERGMNNLICDNKEYIKAISKMSKNISRLYDFVRKKHIKIMSLKLILKKRGIYNDALKNEIKKYEDIFCKKFDLKNIYFDYDDEYDD
jgi:hypothetical protein